MYLVEKHVKSQLCRLCIPQRLHISFWRWVERCYHQSIRVQCWNLNVWCLSLNMNYKAKTGGVRFFWWCWSKKYQIKIPFFPPLYIIILGPSWNVTPDSAGQFSALSPLWGSAYWSLLSWSHREKRGAEAEKDKMVLACSLCTLVYTLLFYFCRVKLKHFEKFQDTTEALAGKWVNTIITKKIKFLSCFSSLITCMCPCSFSFLSF